MSTTAATPAEVDPRYPVGKFRRADVDLVHHEAAIATLAALPSSLRSAVADLTQEQLGTPYREGGWTVRQLVHRLADSHANAVIRVRLALTEDWPTIKPYDEKLWAELPDARSLPVEVSLELLDTLHRRWVALLEALTDEQWKRGYVHPESGQNTLERVAQIYAWHSRHHVAHITALRKSRGW